MPSQLYTEALAEAYALAPATAVHLHTLELRHPSIVESMFIIQGFQNKDLTLETGATKRFRALPFDFTLPATNEGGLQELTLKIDNVENQVSDFCEVAMNFSAPIEIYYRPYLASDPTQPQMNPPLRLFLLQATISGADVVGRAAPVDFLNMEFPSEDYDRTRFPALGNQ